MTRVHARIIQVAALILAPVVATASAQTVDQSNYANYSGFSYGEFYVGQTFKPTANTVAGGGFNLTEWYSGAGTSGLLEIQLWSDIPSASGATLLASGTTSFALGAYQQSFFDVFWPAVSVTPGATYFLGMHTTPSGQYNPVVTFSYGDSYAAGGVWYNGSYTATDPYYDYNQYGYDLTFQEYAAAVPEPATVVLFGTGLVAVFGIARRRRNMAA